MGSKLKEHFSVIGRSFDRVEDSANTLLHEIFPDQTTELLSGYERVYDLNPTGTIQDRQNRVVSAMRQRGGITKTYYESIGNAMGGSVYSVSISEGIGNIPFTVAPYSVYTSPQGPATTIPGYITAPPFGANQFLITVTVTGVASADDLEALFYRIKPAWCEFVYVYIP